MDLTQILALLGLGSAGGKVAWIVSIASTIYGWYVKNKEKIAAIILRIEKERTDEQGWTPEEKEQLAVDIFFNEVYTQLPAWIRLIPFRKAIIENIIRKMIKGICSKAKTVTEVVKTEIAK